MLQLQRCAPMTTDLFRNLPYTFGRGQGPNMSQKTTKKSDESTEIRLEVKNWATVLTTKSWIWSWRIHEWGTILWMKLPHQQVWSFQHAVNPLQFPSDSHTTYPQNDGSRPGSFSLNSCIRHNRFKWRSQNLSAIVTSFFASQQPFQRIQIWKVT